jgi:rare lipoprotein A
MAMIARFFVYLLTASVLGLFSTGLVQAKDGNPGRSGMASIYSYKGGRTASGERVQPGELTAAHRSLPFGTMVRVTNRRNGRQVVVRINDRGPFIRGRIIDITPAAARTLGFSGLAPVTVEVVRRG